MIGFCQTNPGDSMLLTGRKWVTRGRALLPAREDPGSDPLEELERKNNHGAEIRKALSAKRMSVVLGPLSVVLKAWSIGQRVGGWRNAQVRLAHLRSRLEARSERTEDGGQLTDYFELRIYYWLLTGHNLGTSASTRRTRIE